ncbi:hypothetical protein D9613_008430 [Agrocybe pediades]|uniref:Uncharacterized protein n=1 Tax=Agrocybe pediades TaxID=84607 RepID=A0A8H4VQK9_9AGAR|nr:hypothetical protein D9613_008430 [Agrocybe pediades]
MDCFDAINNSRKEHLPCYMGGKAFLQETTWMVLESEDVLHLYDNYCVKYVECNFVAKVAEDFNPSRITIDNQTLQEDPATNFAEHARIAIRLERPTNTIYASHYDNVKWNLTMLEDVLHSFSSTKKPVGSVLSGDDIVLLHPLFIRKDSIPSDNQHRADLAEEDMKFLETKSERGEEIASLRDSHTINTIHVHKDGNMFRESSMMDWQSSLTGRYVHVTFHLIYDGVRHAFKANIKKITYW